MTKLNGWMTGCVVFVLGAATATATLAQTFTTLVTFTGENGYGPAQFMSLVQGTDGDFYGTGYESAHSHGTVFKITPSGTLTALYSFCAEKGCADGADPYTGLVLGTDGNFYGTTSLGGANDKGTVFRVTPRGVETVLYSFQGTTDGYNPFAPLIQGIDGDLYGSTQEGGNPVCENYGCGTLFKITTKGALTTFYSFNNSDGAYPSGALVQALDGNFYGTTLGGGANLDGTVFKITPEGTLTTLHSFCSQHNCTDGQAPFAGLIQAGNGNFYGITEAAGGLNSKGTVFTITRAGAFGTVYRFDSSDGGSTFPDGAFPVAGVVQASDGNLYGTTSYGGSSTQCFPGCGTVFQIASTGALTNLHSFCTQPECADGTIPSGGLLQSTNGQFYGTTTEGGDLNCGTHRSGCGTIFSLDIGLAPFVSFVQAAGKVGQTGGILGQGFTGTTSVTLNGIPADFTVVSDTFIKATVPSGATTGYVTVTTPTGVLTSNVPFHVIP